MLTVTPEQALMVIDGTKKMIENSPVIIDSIKYVADNGIKEGGIEIATNIFKDTIQANGGVLKTVGNVMTAEGGYQEGLKELGLTAMKSVRTTVQSNTKSIVRSPYEPLEIPSENTSAISNNINKVGRTSSNMVKSSLATVGKAGAVGLVVGMTTETIFSYKDYKDGKLSKNQYMKEVLKSGGQMGINGMATSGIMIPIKVALGTVGVSSAYVTMPVSIVLGAAIDKVIAPAFGRGDYKKILDEARYYQSLMDMQNDLVNAINSANEQFVTFVDEYQGQLETHQTLNAINRFLQQQHSVADVKLKQQNASLNNTFSALGDLYSKI